MITQCRNCAGPLVFDPEKQMLVCDHCGSEFKPEEYWSIDAKFIPKGSRKAFPAAFYGDRNGKIKIENGEQAQKLLDEMKDAPAVVENVKHGTRRKKPAPPFITSTLQQEASRKLGFQSRRTMRVAQELYEGVDIQGMGATGLITYMRTDSLRLSEDALDAAESFIRAKWGNKYVPKEHRHFKSRSNAQDGHEAIRPTMVDLEPSKVKGSLTADQYKLYKLIWERFIACQMAECVQKTTQADIAVKDYIFKASGYVVDFDGYTVLYVESNDSADDEKESELPELTKEMPLKVKEMLPNQHFTQPPARYTDGIGRPSTYAATISTITTRGYVKREAKTLIPTELGEVSTKIMEERFPNIANVKFTAQMEQNLDTVEEGKYEWVQLLTDFYGDFDKTLKAAKEDMKDVKIQLDEDKTDLICDKCGKPMVVKYGRYGRFIACSGYPDCKNIVKIVNKIGVPCPKCGGDVIAKNTKKGRQFFGCSNYPDCDFVSWYEPTTEKCPNCGSILFKKKGKKPKLFCSNDGCGFEKDLEESE